MKPPKHPPQTPALSRRARHAIAAAMIVAAVAATANMTLAISRQADQWNTTPSVQHQSTQPTTTTRPATRASKTSQPTRAHTSRLGDFLKVAGTTLLVSLAAFVTALLAIRLGVRQPL